MGLKQNVKESLKILPHVKKVRNDKKSVQHWKKGFSTSFFFFLEKEKERSDEEYILFWIAPFIKMIANGVTNEQKNVFD